MEITYAGGSSFLIKGERTIAINPTEKATEADVVLCTERRRATKLLVNGPGEFEIGGVLIASVPVGDRLIYALEVDGINVVHAVGDEKRLTERDLEAIGKVDVLLVEAEDERRAGTAVSDLMARVVIPFGARAAEVCAAAGAKEISPQARFTWNGTTQPPRAVLLRASSTKKHAA